MTEQERPPYLPELPQQYPRTQYVPDTAPAPVQPDETQRSRDELVAAGSAPPPVDAGGVVAAEPGETPPPAEVREQERVTLTGRLGQNPRVCTTSKGTLIAQFPRGVKDDADLNTTTWHQVLAFRRLAERARDTLKQGDAVEVIGYRHTREISGRNGPRTVQEIYATVLKPRS